MALLSQRVVGTADDPRLPALPGAVAAGYTRALLGVVLAEQEQIRLAALHARDRAEDGAAGQRGAVPGGVHRRRRRDRHRRRRRPDPRRQPGAGATCSATRRSEFRAVRSPSSCTRTTRASIWDDYRDLVEGRRESFRTEKRFFRADGATIWTQLTVSLIRGAGRRADVPGRDHRGRHRSAPADRAARVRGDPRPADRPGQPGAVPQPARRGARRPDPGRPGRALPARPGQLQGHQRLARPHGRRPAAHRRRRPAHRRGRRGRTGGLVARLGGDEFVVLTRHAEPGRSCDELARAVLAAVAVAGHDRRLPAGGDREHRRRRRAGRRHHRPPT